MTQAPVLSSDRDTIERVIETYINGGIFGKSIDMKPAFHENATIHGYLGPELIAGPIQVLYDWIDSNEPASELTGELAAIDICETIATVRAECYNWAGHRFTDMFTLLKTDGEWKIISKVFYLHPES